MGIACGPDYLELSQSYSNVAGKLFTLTSIAAHLASLEAVTHFLPSILELIQGFGILTGPMHRDEVPPGVILLLFSFLACLLQTTLVYKTASLRILAERYCSWTLRLRRHCLHWWCVYWGAEARAECKHPCCYTWHTPACAGQTVFSIQ